MTRCLYHTFVRDNVTRRMIEGLKAMKNLNEKYVVHEIVIAINEGVKDRIY